MSEETNTQATTTESATSTTQDNQSTNQSTENNTNTSANAGVKTFTQAEVDAMIEKRLARERKKHGQQNAQTSNAAQGTAATESAVQTVEVDVTEDARQQAAVIIAQANQRLIQAIAQTEAAKLNINPEYVADAVKLADLSAVKVGEDGTVDSKSIADALEAVVKRMPVLKATAEAPAGGFKVGGQGNNQQGSVWGSTSAKNSGEIKRWNKNRY